MLASQPDATLMRGRARRFAEAAGCDTRSQWRYAIAASEAATNIVQHAGGGSILLRHVPPFLELEAVDCGPGIPDLERALEDGISEGVEVTGASYRPTRRGLGAGLGAITRLMDHVEIASSTSGTRIVARMRV